MPGLLNGPSDRGAPLRLARRLVGPRSLWIRYRPRGWPGRDAPWTDPGSGRLGTRRRAERLPTLWRPAAAPDDLVHLPPVPRALDGARRQLAAALAEAGTPVLVQLLPREAEPERGLALWDLTAALVTGDLEALGSLPAGAAALWPLIPGVADVPEALAAGLAALSAAGVEVVAAVTPALRPAERRRLARAGDEALFQALFHGRPLPFRTFARAVSEHGMSAWLERPLPALPGGRNGNRRLAACLASIGDLWLELGRGEARGQELFAIARRVDRLPHDLEALWREGNLGVVDWLDEVARTAADELFAGRESSLRNELRAALLAAG